MQHAAPHAPSSRSTVAAVAGASVAAPPTLSRPAGATPGRVLQALLVAVLVGLLLPLLVGRPVDAGPVSVPTVAVVSVAPGDTLWGIAEAHLPDGYDLRTFVADIREANDLRDARLQAWQRLRIPAVPTGEG